MEACPRCKTPWPSSRGFCPHDGTLRHSGVVVGDRYELERLIGTGRKAMVYAGRDRVLGRTVAVKILRQDLCTDPNEVAAFLREARLCSQLRHDNLVEISDFGRDSTGDLYLVTSRLAGASLATRLADGHPLPVGEAISLLRQICAGLSAAHGAGLVHRDLSPRNVFLTEGSGQTPVVKLVDFGISHLGGDLVPETGLVCNTTPYMPPEEQRGYREQDHRVDIYALGVMAHEMLTGTLPFHEEASPAFAGASDSRDAMDVMKSRLGKEHPQLVALVTECLSADPKRRPVSAEEVEQRLLSSASLASASDQKDNLVGIRAGSYRLVRLLGSGGLGSVWLAEHPVIGSKVAVKTLHPQVCGSAEAVRRFVSEAQAVNRMESPHIVKIFDFGKLSDGRDYAVMEFLEGETLGERLQKRGRLSWEECQGMGLQVAKALETAHQAGVIHRDLKPDNIFLTGDPAAPLVKVLDFGIAKLLARDNTSVHDTQVGIAMGTPLYAPLEQLAGQAVGPSADLYALGCVLYEMLYGQPPFVGTLSRIVGAKMHEDPVSIGERVPGLDPRVVHLIMTMISRDPEERPTDAARVIAALQATGPVNLAAARTPTLMGLPASPAVSPRPPPGTDAISPFERTQPFGSGVDREARTTRSLKSGALSPVPAAPRATGRPPSPVAATLAGEGPATRTSPAPRAAVPPASPLAVATPAPSVALDSLPLRAESACGPLPETTGATGERTAPSRRRWPLVVALGATVAVGIGGAVALRRSGEHPPASEGTNEPYLARTVVPDQAIAVPLHEDASPDHGSPAETSRDAGSRGRLITLRSVPPGARVFVEGREAGLTPLTVELDPQDASTEVELVKRGYRRARQRLDQTTAGPVMVRLTPLPRAAGDERQEKAGADSVATPPAQEPPIPPKSPSKEKATQKPSLENPFEE